MNRSRHLILPVLALCLVACSKEESRETGGLVMHTITAGIEGATKVQLNPGADTKVLWSAGEAVDVWVGKAAYTFTGQNASAAASTKFEGTAPAELGTWVLVAPEGASTGKSGDNITATLPSVQTALAGGFDPAAAIVAGRGTGSTVICKHLYSGIRFKLTDSGIKSISLRGNNGEKIAGTFTFSFDISSGNPVITGGSSETIVLNAPGGGTFATGTWYYMLCLPTTFSKGVTITADNGTRVGYFTTETSTTFTRTKIKNKDGLTIGNWADIGLAGTVHYGPANTICLEPNESATIDVAPYLTTAKWQRSGIPADAVLPGSVEILWGGPFASLKISDGGKTITITAGESEGSSLIAIKNGESILWSYLIWVKSSFSETTLNGKILLPPLGDNCYFQWGRKDPLLSDAIQLGNDFHGLENSIKNPLYFIKGVSSAWDWFCGASGQDATLWGGDSGRKTVWDPCPMGYRVPSEADYTSITFEDITTEKGFLQLGFYGRDNYFGLNNSASYWTRTVSGFDSSALDDNSDPDYGHPSSVFDGFHRDYALPVRCVKE